MVADNVHPLETPARGQRKREEKKSGLMDDYQLGREGYLG
jgi:hypothetical protein